MSRWSSSRIKRLIRAFLSSSLLEDSKGLAKCVISEIMTEALRDNPFVPGIGIAPPVMGHRAEVEEPLLNVLSRLQKTKIGPNYAYLYGPRGNGKTVLLGWLGRRAKADRRVSLLSLTPDDLESDKALQRALLSTGRFMQWFIRNVNMTFSTGGASISAGVQNEDAQNKISIPVKKNGLLITLDEAHTVSAIRLRRFMNAVQEAGQVMPVALVLAGTPGLEDTLRASGASYWSRGLQLGVGRLDLGEAERVIAEPFKDAGITVSDGIAADLAMAADCYPFFLQVYGQAGWEFLASSGKRHIGPDQAAEAAGQGDIRRRLYYHERFGEFVEARALALARAVALGFQEAGGNLTESQMNVLLERDHGDGLDLAGRLRFLRARGYIWFTRTGRWEPGIPSLMDYMIEVTQQ